MPVYRVDSRYCSICGMIHVHSSDLWDAMDGAVKSGQLYRVVVNGEIVVHPEAEESESE